MLAFESILKCLSEGQRITYLYYVFIRLQAETLNLEHVENLDCEHAKPKHASGEAAWRETRASQSLNN